MLYGVSRSVSTLKWETACSKTLNTNQDTRQIEEKHDIPVMPVRFQTVVFVVEKASANKELKKFSHYMHRYNVRSRSNINIKR
jgi:hypothetical protein